MNRLNRWNLLGLLVVLFASPASAQLQASSEKSQLADRSEIQQAMDARSQAWVREDVQTLVDGYVPDADCINSSGTHFVGRESLQKQYQEIFASGRFRGAKIEQSVASIRFIGPETALVDVNLVYELPRPAPSTKKVRSFIVIVRTDGKWLISALRSAVDQSGH